MLKQKIDAKKKIFKDEYKPTKEEEKFFKKRLIRTIQKLLVDW
ncbi:hypothetical protein [Campylobacter concisus]